MNLESRRIPRRALLALGLVIGLTACPSVPEIVDRPDPPPPGPSTIPPEIGGLRPTSGSRNQLPTVNVTVTFKEDMESSSLDTNTFSLWSGGEHAQASVVYDAGTKTATLDPDDPLPGGGKKFTAYLNGVKTAAGTTVDSFSWDFYTQ